MTQELTPKQQLIYDFIRSYVEERQIPPSLREIGAHFDLSVGAVQDQVNAIKRKGFLEKEETKARGLRLPIRAREIPILGRIHAGPLHLSFENVEGYLPAGGRPFFAPHFALRVQGDSMMEAGILEGDLVIVRPQPVAESGDIVVARVGDETTVKFLKARGEKVELEPANPHYKPIRGIFSIIGVVVEVRRHLKRWRR